MIRTLLHIALAACAGALFAAAVSAEVGDIAFKRDGPGTDDVPAATFPHFVHRMQFKCYVCHEDIFVMKAGANAMTMDAIQDGKFCGACHNGKAAFQATFNSCPRCHRPL
ncbi:MAG: hypothetical protein GZ089_00465 [Aromatoleum sp.]|nr:hypothetical protein [Aromatoleum sp.]